MPKQPTPARQPQNNTGPTEAVYPTVAVTSVQTIVNVYLRDARKAEVLSSRFTVGRPPCHGCDVVTAIYRTPEGYRVFVGDQSFSVGASNVASVR